MKRTRHQAFRCTRANPRQSPRTPEGPWALLPREMVKEVAASLFNDCRSTSYGILSLGRTSRSLHEVVLEVCRERWGADYLKVKKDCREHDWRLPHPTLGKDVRQLYQTVYLFRDIGFRDESQLGWLNSTLFAAAVWEDAEPVLSCIDTEYNDRRGRAMEKWRQTSTANQTMAQLIEFVQPYIERNVLSPIFKVMIPRWAALDIDDCLVHLLLWMERHSASWEEVAYFRQEFIVSVLEYKLHATNKKGLKDIQSGWGCWRDVWDSTTLYELMDYWRGQESRRREVLQLDAFWKFAGVEEIKIV